MTPPLERRRRHLVKPGLQLRLVLAFGGLSLGGLLLQFAILGILVTRSARELPHGEALADALPGFFLVGLGVSLAVVLPLALLVGVALTFRFAGPVYRFEQYLLALARGERLGPCRLRKGDDLQFLCHAINLATEPLRREAEAPRSRAA